MFLYIIKTFMIGITIVSLMSLVHSNQTSSQNDSKVITTTKIPFHYDTSIEMNISETTDTGEIFDTNVTYPSLDNSTDVESTTFMSETTTAEISVDSELKERSLASEDLCLCDLTTPSCDINCCCDKDCSEENKKVFSQCKTRTPKYTDQQYCIQEQLLYKHNTPYKAQVASKDTLCIVTDNLKDRHFFPTVKEANSLEEYENLVQRAKRRYSWEKNLDFETLPEKNNVEGALIWAERKDGHLFPFELPSSFASDECHVRERIFYLQGYADGCTIRLESIANQCQNESIFSANVYSDLTFVGRIQKEEELPDEEELTTATTTTTKSPIDASTQTSQVNLQTTAPTANNDSETVNKVDTEVKLTPQTLKKYRSASNSVRKMFSTSIPMTVFLCDERPSSLLLCYQVETLPTPSFEGGQCKNVLEKIHFTFLHNGIFGIQEVLAKIQIKNLTSEMTTLKQDYKVAFQWLEDNVTEIFQRSGNPGYVQERPILMGYVQSNDTMQENFRDAEKWIHLDKNPAHWLTVLSMGPDLLCSRRISVNFKEDLYSGCQHVISVDQNSESCDSLRQEILSLLLGPIQNFDNKLRIGMFGDSNVYRTRDWISPNVSDELKILNGDTNIKNKPTFCSNLISSLIIEIAYAYQGSFENPQAKIVGMVVKPTKFQQTPKHRGARMHRKFSEKSQTLAVMDLSTTVMFVDVTKETEREYPEAPSLDLKLPYDFFYPLMPSKGTVVGCSFWAKTTGLLIWLLFI